MATTLADRLKEQRRRHFVGRMEEKALLRDALKARELPFLLFYGYGPGGVGKTSLLREFAAIAEDLDVATFTIDARFVPPNPESCEWALMQVTGTSSPADARKVLSAKRAILFIDTFELLHTLEGWFREEFLPSMPDTLLTVVMGRRRPSHAWMSDSAWRRLAKIVGLRNFNEDESRKYLASQEVSPDRFADLLKFTHGHPLALSLVCETLAQNQSLKFDPETNPDIINLLLERFMDSVPSPLHRQALEASSMLRNTSEALLAAVVDSERSFELFEWLKTLTFIEAGPFGVYPHDLAREAISLELRWRNPDDLARLHDKARAYYADHLERTSGLAQQAILSDYIYLHRDNPSIKPFFNWDLSSSYVDLAKPSDHNEILQIVRKYEGEASEKVAKVWLKSGASHIQVLRNSQEVGITGFLLTIESSAAMQSEIDQDPGVKRCIGYLSEKAPLRQGERSLIYRYWMSREGYQDVCPDQSLLFVAIVFSSLTAQNLAHDFQVCANPDFFAPMFEYASLPRLKEADFKIGDKTYGVFGHDWRSLPIKAWLALMSERELPVAGAAPPTVKAEEVVVLSQSSFEESVLQALKTFNNPARLAENPLLKSRIVLDRVSPDADSRERIRNLREAIFEQAKTLVASSKDAKLFQALETYYIKPARSQEAAAEQVDVSIASYRRHLKAGVQRVVELLWQIETGG
ncbi:MAG: ATP-binding protein [Chlorobia bacterium]|nr:ATP-binding protein [Fimbriimonadaceae bacterium]